MKSPCRLDPDAKKARSCEGCRKIHVKCLWPSKEEFEQRSDEPGAGGSVPAPVPTSVPVARPVPRRPKRRNKTRRGDSAVALGVKVKGDLEGDGVDTPPFSEEELLERQKHALNDELATVATRIAVLAAMSEALTAELQKVKSRLRELDSEDVEMVDE